MRRRLASRRTSRSNSARTAPRPLGSAAPATRPAVPSSSQPSPARTEPPCGPQNKQSDLAWRLYTRLDAAGSASLAKPEYTAFLHAVGSIGVAPLAARAGAGSRRRARLTPDPGP